MKPTSPHIVPLGIFKISFMLGALLFLTVMANAPIPDIPWFALSEVNELNEINEQQHAKWLNPNLQQHIPATETIFGKSLASIFADEYLLPLSWVEMVQTPPPELT